MKATTVNYHSAEGVRSAICLKGHKLLTLIYIDGTVLCKRIPQSGSRHLQPLVRGGEPYPVKRAVRQFRKASRALGITKGAAKALRNMS